MPPRPRRARRRPSDTRTEAERHSARRRARVDLDRSGGPPAALAAATGTDPDALRRRLRALAGAGVFAKDSEGCFGLTPMAETLRTDAPSGSLRDLAILLGERESWQVWGVLEHSIRTGRLAFDHVFGQPFFDYFATHPGSAARFDAAMSSRSVRRPKPSSPPSTPPRSRGR